ncbi:hypothetical protein [Flagellimonas allohymeniacidonis]|uniref:Uncharacterized protein n=1 Tax=Flagellimonas allohymeniacidonis TaxID=2517819 RepID=A0A4Q8QGW5_9FLAO|nr:hypothetical protein [Allomuricauda hymeniacidonis]TAI48987.1 hypothetical protein EW142_04105 [Allomuricauda hymeniacidonis]
MNILKQFYHEYQKHIFAYSLVLGIIILLLAYSTWITNNTVVEVMKVVGPVIISSGVFSAIVRSDQFTEIYKKELEKIIYCDDHLKHRRDVHELWEKISKQLYQDKFPELSRKISETLMNYFPIASEHYYHEYTYRIDISFVDEQKEYIRLSEKEDYVIISNRDKKVDYKSSTMFKFPAEDNERSDYSLDSFKINGKLSMPDEKQLTKNRNNKTGTISVEHKRVLSGENRYVICKEETKVYSLKIENTKSHTASWLFDKYHLEVTYPKELKLKFYEKGTIKRFRVDVRKANGLNILKADYDGLMLPNQGVRLIFSK